MRKLGHALTWLGAVSIAGMSLVACGGDDSPTGSRDTTAPNITNRTPAANSVESDLDADIVVIFSESIDASTVTDATFRVSNGANAVSGALNVADATVTFDPTASLAAASTFTVRVTTGVQDQAGNGLETESTWTFQTVSLDGTSPTVVAVSPANSEVIVDASAQIEVAFSEPMDASSLNASTFTLRRGTTAVAGTIAGSGDIYTFTPSAALLEDTVYSGRITTGARDVAGNPLAADYAWSFRMSDLTPPSVSSVSPVDDADDVRVDLPIKVRFDEPIQDGWDTSRVRICEGDCPAEGGGIATTQTLSSDGREITITPVDDLTEFTTRYQLAVPADSGIRDLDGNPLEFGFASRFTTPLLVELKNYRFVNLRAEATATPEYLDLDVNEQTIAADFDPSGGRQLWYFTQTSPDGSGGTVYRLNNRGSSGTKGLRGNTLANAPAEMASYGGTSTQRWRVLPPAYPDGSPIVDASYTRSFRITSQAAFAAADPLLLGLNGGFVMRTYSSFNNDLAKVVHWRIVPED